jgi:hypothetical protein
VNVETAAVSFDNPHRNIETGTLTDIFRREERLEDS